METNTVLRWATAFALVAVTACQAPSVSPSTATPAPAVTSARVDVLNQANAAYSRGDVAAASALYERVINTPPAGEPAETSRAITDFARFRDAVTLLDQGQEEEARAQVDALQQEDANAALARLAAQLWDQYGMVGSMRGACAQLQPQLASQAGPTLAALQTLGVSVDAQNLCS